MGYNTSFSGLIEITPALDEEIVDRINAYEPSNWEASPSSLKWDGEEKAYEMEDWLAFFIKYVIPKGHKLNGELTAHGEEPDDIWLLRCANNVVTVHHAEVVFPEEGAVVEPSRPNCRGQFRVWEIGVGLVPATPCEDAS